MIAKLRIPLALACCTLGSLVASAGATPPTHAGELTAAEKVELTTAFERTLASDFESDLARMCAVKAHPEKTACAVSGKCGVACDCAPASQLLAMALVKQPGAWDVVAPLIRAGFQDKTTTPEKKQRMLDLVAATRSELADGLALELFKAESKSFTTDQLLTFAEGYAKSGYGKSTDAYGTENESGPFQAALAQRATKDVRAAAFTAMHGDQDAAKTLHKAAEPKSLECGAADMLVAARVLAKLGDKEAWAKAQQRVHAEVVEALDKRDVERARDLALEAEFLYEALNGKKGSGLGYLDRYVVFHRAARSGELATADQVFELIESITPL